MKKTGRGRGYDKALTQNLIKSIRTNNRITTTKKRAQTIKTAIDLDSSEQIRITPFGIRKGDSAKLVVIELISKKSEAKKTTKTAQTETKTTKPKTSKKSQVEKSKTTKKESKSKK